VEGSGGGVRRWPARRSSSLKSRASVSVNSSEYPFAAQPRTEPHVRASFAPSVVAASAAHPSPATSRHGVRASAAAAPPSPPRSSPPAAASVVATARTYAPKSCSGAARCRHAGLRAQYS